MSLLDRWRPVRRPMVPTEPVRRWLVLQQGPNPSTDYYIRPRAEASGCPVVYRHLDQDAPTPQDLLPGTRVVVVRYLTPAWARALAKAQAAGALAGVVYFMDDDLLDPSAWRGLPDAYRRKLDRLCARMAGPIGRLASEYWVSTAALQARHAGRGPRLVPPQMLAEDAGQAPCPVRPGEPVQVFYHGTAAHLDEMRWLRPVIARVLDACPQVHFEAIGDLEVHRLFRDLPRTRVLHPMGWPNYLAHGRQMRGHVGLAPLLPGAFNAARSATKLHDILRCRALAVSARAAAYPEAPGPGSVVGHRLEMAPAVWVQALIDAVEGTQAVATAGAATGEAPRSPA